MKSSTSLGVKFQRCLNEARNVFHLFVDAERSTGEDDFLDGASRPRLGANVLIFSLLVLLDRGLSLLDLVAASRGGNCSGRADVTAAMLPDAEGGREEC